MDETCRIQRVWGYIEIHWDVDNVFIDIAIHGEKQGMKCYGNVFVGITTDYLIIAGPDDPINVWKRGDIQPRKHTSDISILFLNSDICYFTRYGWEGEESILRVVSTKLLLDWLHDDHDLFKFGSLLTKSDDLGPMIDKLDIVNADNIGHIIAQDSNGEYGLLDYTVIPYREIETSYPNRYILNLDGKYIATTYQDFNREPDEYIDRLVVEEYKINRYELGKVINRTIVKSCTSKITGITLRVEDGAILTWIDSETLLIYGSKAILLNVSTCESLDITQHTGDTEDSDELFIISNSEELGIKAVRKWAGWLKYHNAEIPEYIPGKVISHIYEYVK
jgi:hypothetical protein